MAERFDRRAFLARVLYGATAAWIAPSINTLPVGALERLALPGPAAPLAARRTILGHAGIYEWWARSYYTAQRDGLVLNRGGRELFDIDTEALRVEPGSYCLRYRLGTCDFYTKPKAPVTVRVNVAGASQVHSVTGYADYFEDRFQDFALGFTVPAPTDLVITFEPPHGAKDPWCAIVEDVTLEQLSTLVVGPSVPCEPIIGGRQLRPNTPLDRHRDDGVLLRSPDDGVCILTPERRVTTMQPETPPPRRFEAAWNLDLECGSYRLGYRLGGYNRNGQCGTVNWDDSRSVVKVFAGDEARAHSVHLDDDLVSHGLVFTVASRLPVPISFEIHDLFGRAVIDEVTLRRLR